MKQTYLHRYFLSVLLLLCGAGLLQAQQVTDTFRYSGQIVRWMVPQGVTSITIQASGAEGSYASFYNDPFRGGLGASIQGTFTVVPGKVLKILVGQHPIFADVHSGGGGSFVTDTFNNPLVIAGGGGGSGLIDSPDKHGQVSTSGGNGGYSGGVGGANGNGGGSGSFTGGGGGGLLTNGGGDQDGGKAFINGGTAGGSTTGKPAGFGGGGFALSVGSGGGGGYSGGGGGKADLNSSNPRGGVGGGGGSINTGTNQTNAGGVNSGDGLVTITYVAVCKPTITASGPTTFCQGGSVTLTASVCNAYLWSNGATTQSITVTQTGSYSVRGINSAGTSPASAAVTVTVNPLPDAPTITVSGPTTFCSISRTVTTLTAPAGFTSYLWSNGSTNRFIVPRQSGSYTVRVTNSNGCTSPASAPVVITVNQSPSLQLVFVAQPSCTFALGNVLIVVENPASGTTYSIDGTNYQTGNYFSNVSPGNYTATVKNANGCTANRDFTVNQPPPVPAAPAVSVTQPTCTTTSSITVNSPTGAAITYSINGTDFQTNNVFNNVAPGNYDVRIKDNGGCASAATSATVNQPPASPAAPTVNVEQPTCTIASGTITITIPIGSGFTYSINGTTYQSGNTFSGVAPGNYIITARNSGGCTSAATSATINPQPATPATPTVSVTQPTCSAPTGTITVTNPGGADVTYSIDGITYQSGTTFRGVAQGSYNITAKNNTVCVSSSALVVINSQPATPAKPVVFTSGPTTFCPGSSVTLTAPVGFASYQWSNGGTTPSITVNQSDSYSVVVRNSDGCSSPASNVITVTVADNEKPVITCPAAQQFCFSSTGTYTIPALQASDNCGIQSTSYAVSGATTRNGMGNNANGSFNPGTSTISWTVTDASNNVSTCTTTVRVNSQILVTIPDSKTLNSNAVAANTVYVGYAPASSITLTANAGGGKGNFTYQWSNGKTTRSITVSPTSTTTYTVVVKDGSNCTGMTSKLISVADVRCGNKLDKVSVCHDGNTICIDKGSVANHLAHPGDMLGECGDMMAGRTTASAINSTEATAASTLATIVYPNPNRGQFSLQLNTNKATKADVQILNAQGMVVNRKTVQTGGKSQTVSFNLSNPVAGTYLIKITSEEGVQVLKMLVQP